MSATSVSIRVPADVLAQVDQLAAVENKARATIVIDLLRLALAPTPVAPAPPVDVVARKLARIEETLGRVLFHVLGVAPEPENVEHATALALSRLKRLDRAIDHGPSVWDKARKST